MKKIIVIGGGFAGLTFCKNIAHEAGRKFDVTLIDRHNHHTFQPLLYQVATGAIPASSILYSLREILKKSAIKVMMGHVTAINKEKKEISLEDGSHLNYDMLVIATGARHHYFGHPQWEEIAPGLKTAKDALYLRDKILTSFEKAERALLLGASAHEIMPFLTFVVIGAGPTGVELSGTLAEIAHQSAFQKNFTMVNLKQVHVILVEALDRVLPMFPKDLSQKALIQLQELGVDVRLSTFVKEVKPNGVVIEDKNNNPSHEDFLATENILWAAGNAASPLLKTLNVPLDKAGRAPVNPDLSLSGHPEIFCLGDCAFVDKVPGVATAAIQMGRYLAKKVILAPRTLPPFHYFDKGSLATIGKWRAVGYSWKIHLSGVTAWMAWAAVHIYYLIGFRNRILVMLEWLSNLLRGVRRNMVIYHGVDDDIPSSSL